MARTAAVNRPDFHAWRAYRVVVDAEAAAEQAAVFEFVPEGRGRVGVWIHGGQAGGIRIGAVHTTRSEVANAKTGIITKKSSYSAVADAMVAKGTVIPAAPIVTGLDSRTAAAALLYGRWIERRGRHRPSGCAACMATRQSAAPGVAPVDTEDRL